MIIDYTSRKLGLKIVLFGPAMSGKTTMVRQIFKYYNLEHHLSYIENSRGRTMFCDYGFLAFALGAGWIADVHIWSATGQDFYSSTRDIVLSATDGIIFVADGQKTLIEDNAQSWTELNQYFKNIGNDMPLYVFLNKTDLPNIISPEELRILLGISNEIPIIKGIAKEGENVMTVFLAVLNKILKKTAEEEIIL